MVALLAGRVSGYCKATLTLKLLFLSQTLKNFLLEYFRDAVSVGKAAVVVWTADGSGPSGWGGLIMF